MPKLKDKLILYASQEISAKSYNLITKKFLRFIMKLFWVDSVYPNFGKSGAHTGFLTTYISRF